MISNSMIIWMIDLSHLSVVLTSTWGDYLDYWPFGCSKEMGNLWNGVCRTVELNLTWERNPSESDGSLTHGQWHPVLLNQWYERGKDKAHEPYGDNGYMDLPDAPKKHSGALQTAIFRLECRMWISISEHYRFASWKAVLFQELGAFPVDFTPED